MMWLSLVVPLTLLFSTQFARQATTYSQQATGASPNQLSPELRARIERNRQTAIEINELAARIHCEADAKELVDKIADVFADTLLPSWITSGIRQRLARAEYEAVADSSRLIPEQRIADVWNEYVREIGAPDEALVTVAELHNLRDGDFASARYLEIHVDNNPIRLAERRYIQQHGPYVLNGVMEKLFDELFPSMD